METKVKITDKRISICEMIAEDVKNDAINFDGKPFTGRTVAEYFGYHGAAIAALADLVKSLLEENLRLRGVVVDEPSVATEAK